MLASGRNWLEIVRFRTTEEFGRFGAARPAWTLLPHLPDSRWLAGRSDTPWYPTMRLFRQPKPRDWASVVNEVGEALRA